MDLIQVIQQTLYEGVRPKYMLFLPNPTLADKMALTSSFRAGNYTTHFTAIDDHNYYITEAGAATPLDNTIHVLLGHKDFILSEIIASHFFH